jgi:capsule polysaccharide export protein KpsE/RkpR
MSEDQAAKIRGMKDELNSVGRELGNLSRQLNERNRSEMLPKIKELKAKFDKLMVEIQQAQSAPAVPRSATGDPTNTPGGKRKSRKRITRKKRTTRRR